TRTMLSRSGAEKVSLSKTKSVTLEGDKSDISATPKSDKIEEPENCVKPRATRDESRKTSRTVKAEECHSPHFEKQSSWGGNRPGAGAPLNNTNAVTHGIYRSELSGEEQGLYDNLLGVTQQLEQELALSRVLLKRAVARDADAQELDKLIAAGQEAEAALNHSPLTLEGWEMFDGEEGNPLNGQKWIKKRPDTGSIVDRKIARVESLETALFKLHGGLRIKRHEQIALQAHVIDQLSSGEITPIEAGRILEREGMAVPTVLAMEIKASLEREEIDDQGGISEEELDAICEKAREHQQQESEWLAGRKAWLSSGALDDRKPH
ncbi:hypothetical protein, partial [Sansalvadorimonas verongulae]|uniref:hypothetical protein n=1 Tax=Sansalvadorimonas verongulae TaxID=2172824 RepID=UPI001E64DA5B